MSININGRMLVKTLKSSFKEEFSLSLRVYDGNKFADDEATLASIRKGDNKGGEFSPKKNMKVGNFEANMMELFGIKVQIAGSDDSYLANNDLTLLRAAEHDQNLMLKRSKRINETEEAESLSNQDSVEVENSAAIANTLIEFTWYLENGESSENSDIQKTDITIDTAKIHEITEAFDENRTDDNLVELLQNTFVTGSDFPANKGLIYDEALSQFVSSAFDDLGWHEVQVHLLTISYGNLVINFEDHESIDTSIQLVRDDESWMYFINF